MSRKSKRRRTRSTRRRTTRACPYLAIARSPRMETLLKRRASKRSRASSGKTVLMIGADWCPYCRRAKPHFARLIQQYSKEMAGQFIDVDQNPTEAAKYRTGTIPTFVFLQGGKKQMVLQNSDPQVLEDYFRRFSRLH